MCQALFGMSRRLWAAPVLPLCHMLPGVVNQPHIVEICNLTRSVKTAHLEEFLLDFMWSGTTANVKWVDDEHALAVFPSAEAAQVLLDSGQKEFKVRPYNKASGAALQIAADGE